MTSERRRTQVLAWLVLVVMIALAGSLAPAGAQDAPADEGTDDATEVAQDTGPELTVSDVRRNLETGEVTVELVAPTALAGSDIPPSAISVLIDDRFVEFDIDEATADSLEVVLAIDVSGSMRDDAIDAAKASARAFIGRLPAEVEVGVVTFADTPTIIAPLGTPHPEILAEIDELEVGGNTAMFDALLSADRMLADGDTARRVVVALTDGADSASVATLNDVRSTYYRAIQLHGFGLDTGETDTVALERLATLTGGSFAQATPEALQPLYEQLAAELSNRFTISFQPRSFDANRVFLVLDHNGVLASTRADFPAAPLAEEAADRVQAEAVPEPERSTFATLESYVIDGSNWLATPTGRNVGLGFVALSFLIVGLVLAFPSERMTLMAQTSKDRVSNAAVSDLTDRLENIADRRLTGDRRTRLTHALERAGLSLRPAEFVVFAAAAAIAVAMLASIFVGALGGIILGVLTAFIIRFEVQRRGRQRQKLFLEQLPGTLQLIAGSLRAGYALPQSAETVANETEAPTCDEFHRLVTEHRLGRDFSEALRAMNNRIGTEDFDWVVQALDIHREVGGDLAEVLDNVNATMRDRNFIRRQFAAVSAEGRYSAYLIVSLPFIVIAALSITSPDYIAGLFDGLRGLIACLIAASLMLIGGVWMKILMKVKF